MLRICERLQGFDVEEVLSGPSKLLQGDEALKGYDPYCALLEGDLYAGTPGLGDRWVGGEQAIEHHGWSIPWGPP